jgi:uncharacterized protein YggU (UPF0235/DUF167 family)
MPTARISVHVNPGASRTVVRGTRGDALVIAVSARPVDGSATDAALTAFADALGLRPRHVSLVSGARSREKVFAIDAPAPLLAAALARVEKLRSPNDTTATSA